MGESDVEMLSGDIGERAMSDNPPRSPTVSAISSRPSPSTDSNPNNPANISNLIHIDGGSEPGAVLTVVDGDSENVDNNNNNAGDNKAKSPATISAISGDKPSSSKPPSAKPRSSKPHKPRSPSPTPPPPPPAAPPLQTIRLEIKLGGPNNYAIDIADICRSTGQRPPTPTRPPGASAVSDSEEEEEDAKSKDKGKVKKKKKNPASEYYDVSDPFIDDSELAIDERTYFAQTKQQGFYVSSGEVALLKDKTPKKPKSKNPLLGGPSTASRPVTISKKSVKTKTEPQGVSVALTSVSGDEGEDSKSRPKADEDGVDDERAGQKRKRYITIVEGGKKRKVVDVHSFHPDLQAAIESIKGAIAAESWDQKGKFPPALKPQLSQLAILAIKLDEYDEHFFNLMPSLFPYNKFTMSKLIKRTVFHDHTTLLMQRQDALLEDLAAHAKAGFSKAEEEWEKSVVAWDKRQEKLRAEAAAGGDTGSSVAGAGTGTDSAAPTRHPTEEMETEPSGGQDKDKDGGLHLQHPPAKKFRMTEPMKGIVWQLVLLSNECCRLENEKNTLEGSVIQVSEQGLRKILYQKIVSAFPEGWMSSGQISRDVSSMKKRLEKEAMEQEA